MTSSATEQKALDIEYHRTAAAKYDELVTRRFGYFHAYSLYPWIRRLVRRTLEASVLDVGAGTGVAACTLARLGCRVHAIDHSPEMLAIAKRRAEDLGVSGRIRFETGDCERLPYPDSNFDGVTIQGVLHHLTEIRPTLSEAVRVLRAEGELYISEPCREKTRISRIVNNLTLPLRWVRRAVAGSQQASVVSEHEEPISGPELVALVESLGLTCQVEYLDHFGLLRFLPESWRILPTLLLSWPNRARRGDLIFLIARKPPAS